MPDTKILKTSVGWVDLDEPTKGYAVRRLARAARRSKRQGTVVSRITTPVTMVALKKDEPFTDLQRKLYHRLTGRQNVAFDDALEIIRDNGYNKAASYGHMRAAGATHSEAKIVIDLSEPAVSVTYGQHRAQGFNHTDALAEALK